MKFTLTYRDDGMQAEVRNVPLEDVPKKMDQFRKLGDLGNIKVSCDADVEDMAFAIMSLCSALCDQTDDIGAAATAVEIVQLAGKIVIDARNKWKKQK